jgi:D-alanyl-D-alanine carboxypeptidase
MKKMTTLSLSLILSCSIYAQIPSFLEYELQDILDMHYNQNFPYGYSASVYIDGLGYWEGTAGYSHDDVQVSSDMLLGIGSNTKLFTAVLCMKFQENGLLSLDDSIHSYLPSFLNIDSSSTIRQLLQHHAGIDDYVNYTMPDLVMENANHTWTTEEILSYVGEPVGEPGQQVVYSSTGYVLAAIILEEISNTNWHTLVRDSILNPLNLENTYAEGFESFSENLAQPWYDGINVNDTSRVGIGTLSWAAGCMVSTPISMAKWYNKLFNTSFLSEESLNEMSTFINWVNFPYKMGVGIYEIKHGTNTYWGHGGQTIGFNSISYYNPSNKSTICVLVNDTNKNPSNIARDLGARIANVNLSLAYTNSDKNLKLYPNPTSGIVKIDAKQLVQVELYNAQGVLLKTCIQEELNLSSQQSGIYYIRVSTQDYVTTKKVVLN